MLTSKKNWKFLYQSNIIECEPSTVAKNKKATIDGIKLHMYFFLLFNDLI